MAASKEDIKSWLASGKAKNATHLVVVCDQFDYDDYPVFVLPGESVERTVAANNAASMQRVVEVYSYKLDLDMQLAEPRAYHLD